ncbi:uncharacterized protein LOC142229233 [Haematobia irritans]|uniref:uncharacterized protein LOC142229233 n=1 Tax=Haematobia irritans TaxID=7368 RepID=UPI003F503FF3
MKISFCVIWSSMVMCGLIVCLSLPSAFTMPLDKIVMNEDNIEPSNIPLILKTSSKSQVNKGNDQAVAESSNIEIAAENPESEGRQLSTDSDISETYNVEVQSENTEHTSDFDIHSQAEDNGSNSNSGFRISLFQAPVKMRESVNLESEAVPSKILSAYDNSQKAIVDKTQLLPIVDTISEHEKYGNNGDMFDGISRSLVNGYEAFSNFLNTIIQKPQQIFKSINKSVNTHLDIIGGKLVGL